jgi:hypothetical protein
MFDADYFRTRLRHDTDAAGGTPIVEIALSNGHVHRIRAVLDVTDGYAVLEAYQLKGDLAHQHPRFADPSAPPSGDATTFRVTLAFESICAVVIDPSPSHVKTRPGFA